VTGQLHAVSGGIQFPKSRPMWLNRELIVSVFCIGMLMLGSSTVLAQQPETPRKSLYERLGEIGEARLGGQPLGGAYKIAAIVSDLIDRLQTNQVINANSKIKRINRPAMPGHKFEFTLMVCSLAGGPQKYAGRTLPEAHQSLEITKKEWAAMLSELKTVLDKHKVPPTEQREFIALIDGTANDVVKPTGAKQQ
jgi:hemoglobin